MIIYSNKKSKANHTHQNIFYNYFILELVCYKFTSFQRILVFFFVLFTQNWLDSTSNAIYQAHFLHFAGYLFIYWQSRKMIISVIGPRLDSLV